MAKRQIATNARGQPIYYGTTADLAAAIEVIEAGAQFYLANGDILESNGAGGWNQVATTGMSHVLAEQPPTPSDGVALSATAASQIVALGDAKQVIISGVQATAVSLRIDFGDSSVTANATTDAPVNVGKSIPARVLAVPPNTGFMAYIRDSAEVADVPFTLVRC